MIGLEKELAETESEAVEVVDLTEAGVRGGVRGREGELASKESSDDLWA